MTPLPGLISTWSGPGGATGLGEEGRSQSLSLSPLSLSFVLSLVGIYKTALYEGKSNAKQVCVC